MTNENITNTQIEEEDIQTGEYPNFRIFYRPDPQIYNIGVEFTPDSDDTRADTLVEDIINQYRGAWEELA